MNVNKTEKLLAARKRLKEFQKTKSNTRQGNISDHKDADKPIQAQNPHAPAEAPSTQELHSSDNTPEANHEIVLTPKDISIPENLMTFADTTSDSPTSNFTPTVEHSEVTGYFDRASEADVPDKNPEPHDQTLEIELLENPTIQHNERESKIHSETVPQLSIDTPSITPPPMQKNQIFENHSINGTTNDSPTSHKEHLLQMASALADALHETADPEDAATSDANLEYRNQFLETCLDEQKHTVNQLHVQVSQYSSRVAELEAILATKDAEFETKLSRELNPLKEQLQIHAQTTGILVAEKTELTSAIEQCRAIAQRKSDEVEELTGRLKTSQSRISELEKELSHVKNMIDDTRKMYQQLHLDYAELNGRYDELQKSKTDDELEVSELRQQISLKNAETLSLQRELEEKNTLLSLNDLKIQQLTNSPEEIKALENQHKAATVREQQLSQLQLELNETLETVNREKDETAKQYENWVRQLDARYEKIVEDNESLKKIIADLEDRERSYIQRMSDLEQNLQRERDKVEKMSPVESHDEHIDHLTKTLDALTVEHTNLQTVLNDRDTEIEGLKRDLDETRRLNDDAIDKSKLVSALESEQLGASRAVAQNQQLKLQLGEMHDAFVTLSNSKLDLTEQLQAERTIGRKLNTHLNTLETEIDGLKEQLSQKERIIRDMETEKLQTAQIADQMHHYQAQSHQARTLQQELQNSLGCIEILRRENHQLSAELNVMRQRETENNKMSNGDENLNDENSRVENSIRKSSRGGWDVNVGTSDPLKKLEVRFKETMERVAELTDEKQRLEHLVLQLQGETETIGEYVTLYQKQRAILQKKATEREEMFGQLVEQRNHQQEQLHKLKVLVADLIRKKSVAAVASDPEASSVIEFEDDHKEKSSNDERSEHLSAGDTVIDVKDKTTSEILDLLTEIKDCKDTCILEPNFHPCPWCSGKLITV